MGSIIYTVEFLYKDTPEIRTSWRSIHNDDAPCTVFCCLHVNTHHNWQHNARIDLDLDSILEFLALSSYVWSSLEIWYFAHSKLDSTQSNSWCRIVLWTTLESGQLELYKIMVLNPTLNEIRISGYFKPPLNIPMQQRNSTEDQAWFVADIKVL